MAVRGFILIAGMRTGSNHLEESLNQADGLTCHGEAFNPAFLGAPGRETLCGVSLAERDRDPAALIQAMVAQTGGMPGFRYFDGHDRWVMEHLIEDPSWAKIILTRPPIESFVSLEIARATDQWRITHARDRKVARVVFDADAFAAYEDRVTGFLAEIRQRLRRSGQAPFDIGYEQILDGAVLNGVLTFLGVPGRIAGPSTRLQRQNPGALRDKVTNPEALEAVLSRRGEAPSAMPDLGPLLAGARVSQRTLFLPLPGVPEEVMLGLSDAEPLPPERLRPWLNRTKGHTVLTAVSHPLARATRLAKGRGMAVGELLEQLASGRLADPAVRPQADHLAALASEVIPDQILRAADDDVPELSAVYDPDLEARARVVYNRDYRIFGYGKWAP